jgi:hypothetical protein
MDTIDYCQCRWPDPVAHFTRSGGLRDYLHYAVSPYRTLRNATHKGTLD